MLRFFAGNLALARLRVEVLLMGAAAAFCVVTSQCCCPGGCRNGKQKPHCDVTMIKIMMSSAAAAGGY